LNKGELSVTFQKQERNDKTIVNLFFILMSARNLTTLLILIFTHFGVISYALETELDPDRAQAMLDISSGKGPEALQTLEHDVHQILEDELQVTIHYLAFRSALLLGKAYLGVRTNGINLNRKIRAHDPYSRIKRAVEHVQKIPAGQRFRLIKLFRKWGLNGSILFYFQKWVEKEKTLGGKAYWKHFQDGEALARVEKIIPGDVTGENFACIALLAAMQELEIYDDSMDSQQIQNAFLSALKIEKQEDESLTSKKHQPAFQDFFHNRYFSVVQLRTFADKKFTHFFKEAMEEDSNLATDAAMNKATGATSAMLERIASVTKSGTRPTMTKFWSIASLRKRLLNSFTNLKPKWPFSLGHFAGNFAKGSAISVVAEALVESAIVIAVGQKRQEVEIGGKEIEYDTQKTTGQKGDGWMQEYINERKFAFLDLADNVTDDWESRTAGLVGGVAFAALVGASFPLTLAAAAVGYAAYRGVKAITNMDWYQNFKHRGLISDLEAMMLKMPFVTGQLRYNPEKIEEVAQLRAREMIKRKKIGKQSPRRIYFMDRLSSLQYEKRGDYWYMFNEDEGQGRVFDVEAHMRYDFLDVEGKQGVWDQKTPQGIHYVGDLALTNGLDIGFLSADSTFDFQEGGKVLNSKKGSNFRVLSNGSIWVRDEENPQSWLVKGLTFNTDIVIRDGKGRFTIDPDRALHTYVTETRLILPRAQSKHTQGTGQTIIETKEPSTGIPPFNDSLRPSSEVSFESSEEVLDEAFLMNNSAP